jgi:rhamnosyltransferase
MPEPAVSVLIRARDEEAGIARLLDALARQTIASGIEVVVVDSGSTDGTVYEARRHGVEPIAIPPEAFTYGGALNLAAERAKAPICVALSAHALPEDSGWCERMLAAFGEERVACAFGARVDPELRPLAAPLFQDHEHAERHPLYGYSNSAGGFRRALWQEHPFDAELAAAEDREWAWHWLRRGWLVKLDPTLAVHHSHDDEGPVRTFRRVREDVRAQRRFRAIPPLSAGALAREWWRGPHGHRSAARARLDPRRLAMLAGKYSGLKGARG